jgi:NADH:ubiquinone reductase (H+-translocating)
VSCTGTAQSPVLRPLPFERDERGRILTDESCQVLGSNHVWAGGDCSAVPHPRGDFYPPLAIYAMEAGKMIGHNIGRTLQGKTQRKVRFSGLGDACALGGRRGVAQLKGVPLKGWIAWVLWRVFMLIYLPSWDRRFRTLSDWILTPFIGRDIVSVPDDAELGITKARYEPGQVIIAEGDTDQTMYVIQEGTVEVEQGGAIVGTLGPGSHFGEKAVFKQAVRTATIRAQSEVKLLVVRREHAQMLQAAGERFSDIVETPSLREKT